MYKNESNRNVVVIVRINLGPHHGL